MRTNILRHVAVALGLTVVATGAHASDYTSPAKWNNFNTETSQPHESVFRTVGTGGANCAPCNNGLNGAIAGQTIIHNSAPMPAPILDAGATSGQIISDNLIHQGAPQVVSSAPITSHVHHGYTQAYSSPRYRGAIGSHLHGAGSRVRNLGSNIGSRLGSNLVGARNGRLASRGSGISPWFGGFNLLFLDVNENGDSRPLIIDDTAGTRRLSASDVAPEDNLAFEIHAGRYLAGGLYGLDFGYFRFDPDVEREIFIPNTGVTYRPLI
ncbi:MAG: hypothetical protein WBD20_12160, partial [Pirellulaceae bacterium]